MKYIKDEYGNFVIFSQNLKHSDVAKALSTKPKSAGFVHVIDNVHTFGESISLSICADKEDGKRIENQLVLG